MGQLMDIDLSSFAAIAFDLDGTLVDSMALHFEAYRRVFASHGLALLRDRFDAAVGGTSREAIPAMADRSFESAMIELIHDEKLAAMEEVLSDNIVPVLPAARLLELAGTTPLALVTSGARQGVERLLARMGWTDHFDVIITGDDVLRGKPDPEPYSEAARRLGQRPRDCLALEDSNAGCASARSAGMKVVDVRHSIWTWPDAT